MIRVERAGVETRLHSSLCAACPQGPTGCCASPPGVDWADIGRIVSRGGAQWLLGEIAAGNLRPGPRGLLLRRVPNPGANAGVWPTKCVYHGPHGCTIDPDRRAATCNYYLCEEAFLAGGENQGDPAALEARETHAALVSLYGQWDLELQEAVEARWSAGPPWDEPFLVWVGEAWRRMVQRDRRRWKALR